MKIQFISDTHCYHKHVVIDEGTDVIIHSGDESNHPNPGQNYWEYLRFLNWYKTVNVPNKILVPGNHSSFIYRSPVLAKEMAEENGIKLLIDEEVTIDGIRIFGSPWTPIFFNWFYMKTEEELTEYYDKLDSYDIFVSHGPPRGIHDMNDGGQFCGSIALLNYIRKTEPSVHCFGHIHEGRGMKKVNNTLFVNASFVDGYYSNYDKIPITIDL